LGELQAIFFDQKLNIYSIIASKVLIRWPDGLSFGPDGYVYVADSDIPDVMMRSKEHMDKNAPYYLWRFKGLAGARAGQ
jgi:hypothetical protein